MRGYVSFVLDPSNDRELTAYLAADGFVDLLLQELGDCVIETRDRLVVTEGAARPVAWAANVWFDVQLREIASINDGSRWLRSLQRNWALYPTGSFRRAALIEQKLPPFRPKPHAFPQPVPTAPLGSWTLWEGDLILASPRCSSSFRHGEVVFLEDRFGPPSRAYLKLWEALTVAGRMPRSGERCVDLGAAPGGWTSVLAGLGCQVLAFDKSDLDADVAALPNVEVRRESAFAVDPASVGSVDWLFSDVICYPERLIRLVERWLASDVRNMVCSVKFQGDTDMASVRALADVPGSRLVHLHHNKHELTWVLLDYGVSDSVDR